MNIEITEDRLFHIRTKNISYLFDIDKNGLLRHIYFGKKVERTEDFYPLPGKDGSAFHSYADPTMEEFSPFGMMRYKETAMKVTFFDGTKDFRYQVTGHKADWNSLVVFLEDVHYPLRVELYYEIFEGADLIKRFVKVVNTGEEKIILERLYSAELGIQEEDMQILNYTGGWASEFQQRSDSLRAGKKVYESLHGTTGHVANPGFILHKNAAEDFGEVYYGALAYTGNFKVVTEVTPYGYTNLLLGMSDTDFCHVLKAGETFETPAAYIGYTDKGFADMSHKAHDFCRRELMPKAFANKPLKVLYNSWYATTFHVKCDEQKKLAEKAADMGIELFVVDDGWFGTRNDACQALGDWYVDANKFPNGLSELISHVNGLGMSFGLWIEPEMVNENSDLYRAHPDWIYRFPNRSPVTGRNQYTLNLTREEVAAYMIDTLDRLLSEHNIAFIKWDMNRSLSETGTCASPARACEGDAEEQKEIWTKHIRSLYRVISTVRERHPDVEFEACAGGGGRVDFGTMQYFDEFWPSDNTDALDRLEIQEGYSFLYPAKYMRAWVTDVSDIGTKRHPSVSFRLHCAMCGALGIGSNLNTLPGHEADAIKSHIEDYKRVRDTVQFGRLYRLKSFKKDDFHSVQYTYEDKSVVFAFLIHQRYRKTRYTLRLKGLEENALYEVREKDGAVTKSGAFLMQYGLDICLQGDYDSRMIELNKLR